MKFMVLEFGKTWMGEVAKLLCNIASLYFVTEKEHLRVVNHKKEIVQTCVKLRSLPLSFPYIADRVKATHSLKMQRKK